jgi:DNA repair protein RadC
MQKLEYSMLEQQSLFDTPAPKSSHNKFISVFRVSLVKDKQVSFGVEECQLNNSQQACPIFRKLIECQGQSDREQFCIVMLNAKNSIIGLNIVSTGNLTSASVMPREVLKPAILSNSAALILCHNHPSEDPTPSAEDIAITERIIQASHLMGIVVHEHLVIAMNEDRYYSFADNGDIKKIYDELN